MTTTLLQNTKCSRSTSCLTEQHDSCNVCLRHWGQSTVHADGRRGIINHGLGRLTCSILQRVTLGLLLKMAKQRDTREKKYHAHGLSSLPVQNKKILKGTSKFIPFNKHLPVSHIRYYCHMYYCNAIYVLNPKISSMDEENFYVVISW